MPPATRHPPPAGCNAANPDCDAWYADMNENGSIEMWDIDGFVDALIGGP